MNLQTFYKSANLPYFYIGKFKKSVESFLHEHFIQFLISLLLECLLNDGKFQKVAPVYMEKVKTKTP